jgi:hypothetical protein
MRFQKETFLLHIFYFIKKTKAKINLFSQKYEDFQTKHTIIKRNSIKCSISKNKLLKTAAAASSRKNNR